MDDKEIQKVNVLNIEGVFRIDAYQRGYRWTKKNVKLLLDDINEHSGLGYCLQPIVTKTREDGSFELIDGQQRLTTLFLMLSALSKQFPQAAPAFSIDYQTRPDSAAFLRKLSALNGKNDPEYEDVKRQSMTTIDFYYMFQAYETVMDCFNESRNYSGNLYDAIREQNSRNKDFSSPGVFLLWYSVPETTDSNNLFHTLNDGRIPLTDAEVIKALFLENNNGIKEDYQRDRITREWDEIEHTLRDEDFWFFLTNAKVSQYQTRIERLIEIWMGEKPKDVREEYDLFFDFQEKIKDLNILDVWKSMRNMFLSLLSWYKDKNLHNRIGYLVKIEETNENVISELLNYAATHKKSELSDEIDSRISATLAYRKEPSQLSFLETSDKKLMGKILLLFNVLTATEYFDFRSYSNEKWSLEHIHAQDSENIQLKDRKEWAELQLEAIRKLGEENSSDELTALIEELSSMLEKEDFTDVRFQSAAERVFSALSPKDVPYIHGLGNMALLSGGDNSALSNSTFDVKRNCILEKDREGRFIPCCTRMVFLKYYTPSNSIQMHFWGEHDRNAYIAAMNEKLGKYLGGKRI